MEIQISPIKPAFDHTVPQRPMSLPPIPRIPPHKRDRRERRRTAPYLSLADAPEPVVLAAAEPFAASVSVSRPAVFIRALTRALENGAIQSLAEKLAPAVLAASAMFFAYQWMAVGAEPAAGAYAAAVFARAEDDRPVTLASYEKRAPADPRSLVVSEDFMGGPAPRGEEPAAQEPEAPAAPEGPAVEASGGAPVIADALKDAVKSTLPKPSRRRRLDWGGVQFQAAAPLGGEFREMRPPQAAPGRAARGAKVRAGRRTALSRSVRRLSGGSKVVPGSSQRAMGQLKMARALSVGGAQSSSFETARQGSSDAFEQSKSIGGAGLSVDATPGTGLSGGAPDLTAPPSTGPGENKTPYQKQVDDAKRKNGMTKMLLILGFLLLAAGAALLVIAQGDVEPATKTMLTNIAYALLGAGAAIILAGFLMGQQAKDDGKAVADQYGQTEQGAVIDDCADQAMGRQDCAPKAVEQPGSTVRQDAKAESEARYSLGGE